MKAKSYEVTFTKCYSYTVQAETEEDAETKALELFKRECCAPVASTFYDECEVECFDDDDDDDEDE